ncbi:hypothetical protein C4K88_03925 [Arthrobacter pityocampae]|uniref:Uncharacterized protein n=1 Tax=Arthrobacter pityocampae TaxID=547334 RepID=A0A2S5IZ64_9MICC|nr:hypothetical protein [Arthrobacter pityocampae]PPB49849.1 hypothetical protein C4K88_03925 [Arthrobacter pityocampae]
MTEYEDAEDEKRRVQRRQRIAVRRRRRLIVNRIATPLVFLFILIFCAGLIALELDEPRQDAALMEFVESHGGEVTKIRHPSGTGYRGNGSGGPAYVDVVFDGRQSRCVYHELAVPPRLLDCDPAVSTSRSEGGR